MGGLNDGEVPVGTLLEASDNILYGLTQFGGATAGQGDGTVFKINKNGSGFAVIHSFGGAPAGASPLDQLLEGTDGRLYGATLEGGRPIKAPSIAWKKTGPIFCLCTPLPKPPPMAVHRRPAWFRPLQDS
ncbi:MAG: hypothetical protein HC880_03360 [Bacteroidia bacterium]|nr:hypothetical protein [Bacteroidia bacterium]